MEIAVDDQHYVVVEFDTQDCMSHRLNSAASFIAHMTSHLAFWISLIGEIARSAEAFGDVENIACALSRLQQFEQGLDTLLQTDLYFVKHLIDYHLQTTQTSGKIHLAHKHLRLKQLLQISKATDGLLLNNPIDAVVSIEFTSDSGRARCMQIIRIFKECVIPRAVAALWAWKTHARSKNSSEIDTNEVQILWLCIMKLRALAMLNNEDNALMNLTLKDVSCVIRKCPISNALRIGDYTMRDLWSILKRLSWDWPLITPGQSMRRLIDALWWRASWLASQAMGSAVANNPILVKRIPDAAIRGNAPRAPLFRVSDHFLLETERIFFTLCDTLWTLNWFEARRLTPTERVNDALVTSSAVSWSAYVRTSLTGQLRDFIKREFAKRIWVYNHRRDEVESYNIDTHTTQGNPTKSIMQYHRSDYDTILTVSNSSPSAVVGPAFDMTMQALKDGLNWHLQNNQTAEDVSSGVVEWQWPSVWELSATHDRDSEGSLVTSEFETFNVRLGDNGERIFTDKVTHRRLRGEQAVAAAALFASTTLQASKNEFDAIVESVLMVQMQATTRGNNPMLRVESDLGEHISLRSLPTNHDALSGAKRSKPAILRIGGYYIVYNGQRVLAQHPLLSYALAIWCREVDSLVESQLMKLGIVCDGLCKNLTENTGGVAREDAIKMLQKASNIAEDVPELLRKLFGVARHPKTVERINDLPTPTSSADRRPAVTSWIGPLLRRVLLEHNLIDATPSASSAINSNTLKQHRPIPDESGAAQKPGISWS